MSLLSSKALFKSRLAVPGVMTETVVDAFGGAVGVLDVEEAAVVVHGIAALKFSAAALPIAVTASSEAPVAKATSFVVLRIHCLLRARASTLSFSAFSASSFCFLAASLLAMSSSEGPLRLVMSWRT